MCFFVCSFNCQPLHSSIVELMDGFKLLINSSRRDSDFIWLDRLGEGENYTKEECRCCCCCCSNILSILAVCRLWMPVLVFFLNGCLINEWGHRIPVATYFRLQRVTIDGKLSLVFVIVFRQKKLLLIFFLKYKVCDDFSKTFSFSIFHFPVLSK